MSLQELAARVRRGEVEDGVLAEYASEYARAHKIYARKKDD
ncbi:hypothetical protein LX15_002677 [Streptoalloteichus tenebrarius]|uniref:Uncharacterized protein n=2 Tax=Streptoalloteichus TaxID=2016 RepID=A0A1M5KS31_STRHI|nr:MULTISPECIES: hypothetical protein [Streptoalloteichus]MCP2258978.1 hypothetical protein [Streptoalloteichus tenebrarius]SHG55672.1 hypothetical protein SAMN05444320_11034 [Streptoalloteichus hindustanus]